MSFLSALKPDPDKWALTFVLFLMYWLIFIVTGLVADYLFAQIYPVLNQPLPYKISLPGDWGPIFEEYWQQVERAKMPFIALKLVISFIGCYLTACLLTYIIKKSDVNASEH